MRSILLLFLFFWLFFDKTYSQPQPCGPNPSMTPTCIEACVICDIDDYTGINDNPITGEAPPGFCTNTEHHIQWIAFIAGSTSLTIEMNVFNCQSGGNNGGLEVGIYESLDCETFNLVSNCDGDIPNNTTGTFTTTEPLTIGQYYYWVMDGNMDDVCNYTINVTQGTTLVPPLPPAGAVSGESLPCIDQTYTYSLPLIVGANFYQWTLDGQSLGLSTGTSVEVEWTQPGLHQLCVTAFNVCDTVAPVCFLVNVLEPIETEINQNICAGDCFEVADTLLCNAGGYEFHLTSWQGCDSAVFVNLALTPTVSSNLSAFICDDDSISVGGQVFYPPGQYEAVATSWLGCDSTIFLSLGAVICEMEGAFNASPLFCHGDQSGSIVFAVTSGTPPFTYTWYELNGSPSGSGNLSNANQNETITHLPPGTYLITVKDNFGNDVVFVVQVNEPPPLALDWAVSDFNGFSVSCFGEMDGSLEAIVSGGTPPYAFLWSNGATTAQVENLGACDYEVTMTDAAGCTLIAQNSLTEPTLLQFIAFFSDPTCDGFNTGSAAINSVSGGVQPYLFSLNNSPFDTIQLFENLPGGTYELTVQDANGCSTTAESALAVPGIPIIDAGEDVTIKLAESARLYVVSSVPPDTIIWSALPGLSCYDCQITDASPVQTTTYTVTVISEDGCTASDSVTVNLLHIRDFYVPNVFSPNADGLNDAVTIYSGPAVMEVSKFLVFDRWGELVFEKHHFQPNDLEAGWDGTFKDKQLKPAVFTWFAEVLFIDGETEKAEGDVSLLR